VTTLYNAAFARAAALTNTVPSPPTLPCYYQHWRGDTSHLSLAAQGLFWRYVCWSWANWPLPLAKESRRQMAGVELPTPGRRSADGLYPN